MVKEVDIFLSRPRLPPRAFHYSLVFLNQIILTQRDSELSRLLVILYFSLFRRLTKGKLANKEDIEKEKEKEKAKKKVKKGKDKKTDKNDPFQSKRGNKSNQFPFILGFFRF